MILIENIDKYCISEGITPKEFERRCSLGNNCTGKWRRGISSPSIKTLEKISEATQIPLENWLRNEGV